MSAIAYGDDWYVANKSKLSRCPVRFLDVGWKCVSFASLSSFCSLFKPSSSSICYFSKIRATVCCHTVVVMNTESVLVHPPCWTNDISTSGFLNILDVLPNFVDDLRLCFISYFLFDDIFRLACFTIPFALNLEFYSKEIRVIFFQISNP